jgi:hypothetical protein
MLYAGEQNSYCFQALKKTFFRKQRIKKNSDIFMELRGKN